MMKRNAIIFLLCVIAITSFSQNRKAIDSLKNIIATAKHDTTIIIAYNFFAEEMVRTNLDSTKFLSEKAVNLSKRTIKNTSSQEIINSANKQLVKSYSMIGVCLMLKGDMNKSFVYHDSSFQIAKKENSREGI